MLSKYNLCTQVCQVCAPSSCSLRLFTTYNSWCVLLQLYTKRLSHSLFPENITEAFTQEQKRLLVVYYNLILFSLWNLLKIQNTNESCLLTETNLGFWWVRSQTPSLWPRIQCGYCENAPGWNKVWMICPLPKAEIHQTFKNMCLWCYSL